MGIVKDQVNYILNKYIRKRMIKDGQLPSPSELQNVVAAASDHSFGTPLFSPRMVSKRRVSNTDIYNKNFEEIGWDLELLFDGVRNLSADSLGMFSHNRIAVEALKAQARRARRDVDTVLLVSERSSGLLDHIKEDFNDLEFVDSLNTTAEVDVKRRLCRLNSASSSKHYFGDAAGATVDVRVEESLEGGGVSAINFYLAEGSGPATSILNDYVNDYYCPVVKKQTDAPIQWVVDVVLPEYVNTSRIQFELSTVKSIQIALTTEDQDGNQQFRGLQSTSNAAEWRFPAVTASKLTFTIRSTHTKVEDAFFLFYLMITNISVFQDRFSDEADLYSTDIDLQFSNRVGRASLETDHDGSVEFYLSAKYDDDTETPWTPIYPVSEAVQGRRVVFGNTTYRTNNLPMDYDSAERLMSTDLIPSRPSTDSLEVVTGLNLLRMDYHVSYIPNQRSIQAQFRPSYQLDPTIRNTGFRVASDLAGGLSLPCFHRYKASFVVYKTDPALLEHSITVNVSKPAQLEATDFIPVRVSIHNIKVSGDRLAGVDSHIVELDETGFSNITFSEGINYITIETDTSPDIPYVNDSTYDLMKTLSLTLTVTDPAQYATGNDEFIMAGPDEMTDVNIFRKLVSLYQIRNKFDPDYDRYGIEEMQTGSQTEFRVCINHPFGAYDPANKEDGVLLAPTENLTEVEALVKWQQVDREIQSVKLWARLSKGPVVPVIRSYTLKFAI